MRRTSTLVSTARMTFSYVPGNPLLQLYQGASLRAPRREEGPVNVFRRDPAGSPHDDMPRVLVPLEYRPRAHPQSTSYLGRNGDLRASSCVTTMINIIRADPRILRRSGAAEPDVVAAIRRGVVVARRREQVRRAAVDAEVAAPEHPDGGFRQVGA